MKILQVMHMGNLFWKWCWRNDGVALLSSWLGWEGSQKAKDGSEVLPAPPFLFFSEWLCRNLYFVE